MRPPPLRLKIDNRYPIHLSRKRERKSVFELLYCTDWRNAVLAVSSINVLRFSLSAFSAYCDVGVDNNLNFLRLAGVSSFLCSVYVTTCLIDIFGILGLVMRRVIFVRIYACLAGLSALVIVLAGTVGGVTFYMFGADVIQECIVLAMAGDLSEKSIFRGQPWPFVQHGLRSTEATRACQAAWASEGPSQIMAIFAFSLLPSVIYSLLVYTYYRQVIDPTHPAYLNEGHSNSATRTETSHPSSPLYNNTPVSTVMPSGTPWDKEEGGSKQPLLMKGLMEYLMTPGPPSFGPYRVQGHGPYWQAIEGASNSVSCRAGKQY